ncbi:PLC-like phosphodiesterase [Macrolepiota fuliginosa MF-IS2]|uniref:PLC-like phosphodiesterase n=1 Tax=Macrolepiota fuliginosa MF-IS2 TaxID=1400762 RepID=A0A9P5XKH3_9AGAR|nr:PLC-like phosphodiesterase [Macrolepiota fuliginosa MF-IS2]
MPSVSSWLFALAQAAIVLGAPPKVSPDSFYDVQGHRGGRGDEIENTLPAFARGLLNGVTSLEMDNGITKDGVVVVWHDEQILDTKCKDTKPVVANDPDFPYVGKFIANLTLAQVKTLDCGSERQLDFPMQLIVPGTKLSTLDEVFDFVKCVDTKREVFFNIESKVNPQFNGTTRGPDDFVNLQHAAFIKSGYPVERITYQSFDWRTLIGMKQLDPRFARSALISSSFAVGANGTVSVWQAGLDISTFPGPTFGEKVAEAAASIGATILSPAAADDATPVPDPTQPGFVPFTTKAMIDKSHQLGLQVKPWTVDDLNIAQQLLDFKADGIITDFATNVRFLAQNAGLKIRPGFDANVVQTCLN